MNSPRNQLGTEIQRKRNARPYFASLTAAVAGTATLAAAGVSSVAGVTPGSAGAVASGAGPAASGAGMGELSWANKAGAKAKLVTKINWNMRVQRCMEASIELRRTIP